MNWGYLYFFRKLPYGRHFAMQMFYMLAIFVWNAMRYRRFGLFDGKKGCYWNGKPVGTTIPRGWQVALGLNNHRQPWMIRVSMRDMHCNSRIVCIIYMSRIFNISWLNIMIDSIGYLSICWFSDPAQTCLKRLQTFLIVKAALCLSTTSLVV